MVCPYCMRKAEEQKRKPREIFYRVMFDFILPIGRIAVVIYGIAKVIGILSEVVVR